MNESSLRSLIECLNHSLDLLAPWLNFWTALVVIGVCLEIIELVHDHLHERTTWRTSRARGEIPFPDKPNLFRLVFGIFAIALVVVGVAGELHANMAADRIEAKLRKANADLELLLGQEAGNARTSAENAADAANRAKNSADDTIRTLNVAELVLRFRTGDDATAKDALLHIYAVGSDAEKQEIQTLAPELVNVAKSEPVPVGICAKPVSSGFQKLIRSQSADTRKATLRDCATLIAAGSLEEVNGRVELRRTVFVHLLVPKLLIIAFNDQNDSVRDESLRTLQQVFANLNFTAADSALSSPDQNSLAKLWNVYGRDYDAFALLSSANAYVARNKANFDSASLYDILQPFEHYPERDLDRKFAELLSEMRTVAKERSSGPITDIVYHHVNDCPDIENMLSQSQPTSAVGNSRIISEIDDNDDPVFQGLRYLGAKKADCSPYPSLVPMVSKFGLTTPQLSRRYAAVLVLNRWAGSNLTDPFDLKVLEDWWRSHSGKYPSKYRPQPWQCPDCG